MDTKNFAELMSQAGLGNNTPVVNVADIAQVSQSIERLIPMLEVKGKGDVNVVKALDKVAKTLASVSKNITIQNVAVPDAVTVKNHPNWSREFATLTQAVNNVTTVLAKSSQTVQNNPQLQELIDSLKELTGSESKDTGSSNEIDLEEYRVADSAEPVTGYQYFGFINQEGGWYIIYNEAAEGKVRYKFGTDNYERNWEMYGNHEYKLLNEAIKEVMPPEVSSNDTIQD